MLRHQFAQEFDAVHARHLHVQGEDIRVEFHDLVAGLIGIAGAGHDFDARVRIEPGGKGLPDKRRVINHQDSNGVRRAHRSLPSR